MRHLYAWDDNELVGRFDEQNDNVTFTYERNATYPISLSLPLNGNWDDQAPAAFLDGLLPEGTNRRLQMMHAIGARSTDAFELLDCVDSTGGLVFTSSPRSITPEPDISLAIDLDIEAQMQRIYDSDDAWWNADKRNRFSLAGSQGKFSLAGMHGMWFWPNVSLPSTHLIKPDGRKIPDVSIVEHATMEIARMCGIPTANTKVVRYGRRTGLLVERFDRHHDEHAHTTRRIRTEDMAQATGAWTRDKYDFAISDIVLRLQESGVDEEVSYDLVRQIAFNAGIGNHDAHAKNYSIFLDTDGVRLCPMYDAISMAHWYEYRYGTLGMPVNGIYDPWEVTIDDWRTEALLCNLNPDRVEDIVTDVETKLLNIDYANLPCGPQIGKEIRSLMLECGRDLIPSIQARRGATRREPSATTNSTTTRQAPASAT